MNQRSTPKMILVLFLLGCVFTLFAGAKPKYVFLFIGDGMSTPQRNIAENYSLKTGGGKLAINHMPFKAPTTTSSADRIVTDSAASGTALACGEKTNNGRIGMDAAGKRKLESVAYVAKKNGKKVGIISSVTINHATPASFYAHRNSRSMYYEIGLDLIASPFDYFAGGGLSKADDKKSPLYKGNLYDLAKAASFTVVNNDLKAFRALKPQEGRRVIVSGSRGYLPFAIDATDKTPSLAELTAKGIELLDNPKGFFMMVEGGSVDVHGHANDAGSNIMEVLDLNKAVLVAMGFARKHPKETLIVVTGDHETGGMSMGFANSGYTFDPSIFRFQKISIVRFGYAVNRGFKRDKNYNFEKCKELMREKLGFRFAADKETTANKDHIKITPAEEKELKEEFDLHYIKKVASIPAAKDKKAAKKKVRKPNFVIKVRVLLARKAGIGWSTGSHTALPVLTTSQGCGAEVFSGKIDNTQVALKLKDLLQK